MLGAAGRGLRFRFSPTCQLVIATRASSPAGIARLRAAGEMTGDGIEYPRFSTVRIGPFVR